MIIYAALKRNTKLYTNLLLHLTLSAYDVISLCKRTELFVKESSETFLLEHCYDTFLPIRY